MTKEDTVNSGLLIKNVDPNPVDLIGQHQDSPFLLVCEHAGAAIPQKLNTLGLKDKQLGLHIATDIGAEKVATGLAELLRCRLILQRYSRLVIDCNRPFGAPDSIPEVSDTIEIPGNIGISSDDKRERETSIFEPYASLCRSEIARENIELAYSIHSFTPQMDGKNRPWDISFLYRRETSQGARLASLCKELWPELMVGQNVPYDIADASDWFIPVCAEPKGIPHCLIEIRNDHLLSAAGCNLWAERLHQLLTNFRSF